MFLMVMLNKPIPVGMNGLNNILRYLVISISIRVGTLLV